MFFSVFHWHYCSREIRCYGEHATLTSVFKYGVPSPVTGSQPGVAFQLANGTNDARPPTSEDPVQPVDPPSTMSVKPVWLSE